MAYINITNSENCLLSLGGLSTTGWSYGERICRWYLKEGSSPTESNYDFKAEASREKFKVEGKKSKLQQDFFVYERIRRGRVQPRNRKAFRGKERGERVLCFDCPFHRYDFVAAIRNAAFSKGAKQIFFGRRTSSIPAKNDDDYHDGYVCNFLVHVQLGILHLHDHEQYFLAVVDLDYQQIR